MLIACILIWIVGALYVWSGALICFGGRYGLVNNFVADRKAGKLDDAYARRYGALSLCGGAVSVAAGIWALLLRGLLGALTLAGGVLLPLAAFRIHYLRSVRPAEAEA